jgi:hypothetical protein
MTQSYRIRLHCLQRGCDFHQWTVKENLALSLKEVYDRAWDFHCPQHGPHNAVPFHAEIVLPVPTQVTTRASSPRHPRLLMVQIAD